MAYSTRRTLGGTGALLSLLTVLVGPAAAQQQAADTLGMAQARLAAERIASPTATVVKGDVRMAPGERLAGSLAVVGGSVDLRGTVAGDLTVVGGSALLGPGARVEGSLLVVGGRVAGRRNAVAGEIQVSPRAPAYWMEDGRLMLAAGPDTLPGIRVEDPDSDGRADLLLATGRSYNRVEGMPITVGPVVEMGGANPLHLRGLLIYRTEAGWRFRSDDIGYYLRADQFLGGRQAYRVGLTLHSLIDPIEGWHLSDLENGLSTFLFRQDYRDHYDRRGWAAFVEYHPQQGPLSLGAEVRMERHGAVAAGSPWTLFRNHEPWRPQPLVAEGTLHTLVTHLTFDRRDRPDDPSFGWIGSVEVEQSLVSDLARPAFVTAGGVTRAPTPFGQFGRAQIDLRQYNRLGPGARLNFRVMGGFDLFGDLPPQRQFALGGVGSLPGFPLFALDCGAREQQVRRPGDGPAAIAPRYYLDYGCDRFALVQVEYRGKLSLRFQWRGGLEEDADPIRLVPGWDAAPDWVAFVDAGRAWSGRGHEDLALDLGAGIAFQRIGLFLAVPLTRGGDVRLFARVGPRF